MISIIAKDTEVPCQKIKRLFLEVKILDLLPNILPFPSTSFLEINKYTNHQINILYAEFPWQATPIALEPSEAKVS